ncbi:hypothetical protein KI387_027882, partial [Taxus chinensis]
MDSRSERRIKHYSNFHQILLVGEGDFSFSSALANAFGSAKNMVPTSLDSRGLKPLLQILFFPFLVQCLSVIISIVQCCFCPVIVQCLSVILDHNILLVCVYIHPFKAEKVESSYKSGKTNLQILERCGAMPLHGVDATSMAKLEILRERKFDRIVYNFPHAGFFGRKEDDEKVIKKHRHLVKMFFKNASIMLSTMGEIHVTHTERHPYSEWKLAEQAEKHGLVLKQSVKFKKSDYPGYTSKRGAGLKIDETFNLGNYRTYMFIKRESMATSVLLPKLSPKANSESLEMLLELGPELQARKAAETAKLEWEAKFRHLEKIIKEKDDALHQKNKALTEKDSTTKQLTKTLSLKEYAIKQKDVSLEKARSELEFGRQALMAAETRKADLEADFEQYRLFVSNELKKMNQVARQRDDALYQKEEACREREIIAKQLDETLKFQKD